MREHGKPLEYVCREKKSNEVKQKKLERNDLVKAVKEKSEGIEKIMQPSQGPVL